MSLWERLFGGKRSADSRILNSIEYAEHFASFVRSKHPGSTVTVKQAATASQTQVAFQSEDGVNISLFMGNWYQRYRNQPDAKHSLFKEQLLEASQTAKTLAQPTTTGTSVVLPVVKTVAWYHAAMEQLRGVGEASPELHYIVEPIAGDLLLTYIEDTPHSMSFFSPSQRDALGLDNLALRELAMRNLERYLPQLELKGGAGRYAARLDRNYDAGMVLLFDRWRDRIEVAGDPVFAIPARDELLVCGSEDLDSIEALRAMAEKIESQSAYSLSLNLYVYRNGSLEVFA